MNCIKCKEDLGSKRYCIKCNIFNCEEHGNLSDLICINGKPVCEECYKSDAIKSISNVIDKTIEVEEKENEDEEMAALAALIAATTAVI